LYGITLVGSVPPLETPMRFALGFDENQPPDSHPNSYTKYIVAGTAVLFLFACISIAIVLAAIAVLPDVFSSSATVSTPVTYIQESGFPTDITPLGMLLVTENSPTVIAFTPVILTPAPTLTPFPTATSTQSPTPTSTATATLTHAPSATDVPKATMTPIVLITPTPTPTQTLHPTEQNTFRSNLSSWTSRGDGGNWSNTSQGLSAFVDNHTDGFYVAQNSYADFTYETTFVMTDGQSTASAGVIFRSHSDPLQGCYMVRVSTYNGGEISLVKFFPVRQYQQLDLTNLPIRLNTQYTIQIIAISTEITVYLNGQRVLHSYDSSFDEGMVGLNINSSATTFYSATVQQN